MKDHRLLIRVVLYVEQTEVINCNMLRAIQTLSVMEEIHRQHFDAQVTFVRRTL